MKIGTLTFHAAHNYGAMLQAYALVTFLRNYGHQAEVINFLPYIHNNYERFPYMYMMYRSRGDHPVYALLRSIKHYKRYKKKTPLWHSFETFLIDYIPKSKRIFYTKDIKGLKYDAIVCGSDQIWNPALTDGYKDCFFGKGMPESIKKISYAGSNGNGMVSCEDETIFLNLISNFDAISVREAGLQHYLITHGIEAKTVLDPVFLLKKEDWFNIAIDCEHENYVFTYSFWEPEHFFETAYEISKQLHLKLICMRYEKTDMPSEDIIQICDKGPREFLGYIKNASFVVTNSFHGTAFSIIMEKQFFNIPPIKTRERTDSIMRMAGLTDHVINTNDKYNISNKIDYEVVNKRMEVHKRHSIEFLLKSLE